MATATASAESVAKSSSSDAGVKETIESILIAFILAFIFRAFVVEAFVIPTGSMAPTLLGAHMRYHCPDCGYEFQVNYSAKNDAAGDPVIPPHAEGTYNAYCPNCAFKMPMENPDDPESRASRPPVHYGDRILVLKYLYLLQQPSRWDVVVFKSPDPPSGPAFSYDFDVNYIKRLIGRPGESILILDGDIYIAESGSGNLQDFEIQTKPRSAQQSLWRIVYDNDFHPQGKSRGRTGWQQPWVSAGNGWDLGSDTVTSRTFSFDNPGGGAKLTFNPEANPDQHSLTDWVAYDTDAYSQAIAPQPVPVSDVKLEMFYERHSGDGALRLRMTKHEDAFTAEFTPTSVRLLRQRNGTDQQIGNIVDLPRTQRPLHIEFSNVDYCVTVRVDGKDLIKTTPHEYRPDLQRLLKAFDDDKMAPRATVQIAAEAQKSSLSHVSLWRDVYYIAQRTARTRRANATKFPQNVLRLGQDEYFVLGDNSAISGDARYWENTVNLPAENLKVEPGRVPARFLLGKAFFVYWPAGYRPMPSLPALSPNFGDMRFIE